jgi:DNA-binding beta-propeller fold protein YncE
MKTHRFGGAGRWLAALVCLATGLTIGCTSGSPGVLEGTPTGASAASAPVETRRDAASPTARPSTATWAAPIVDVFDVGGSGWAMTESGGDLWVQVDPPVDAIVRLDPETGAATLAVSAGHKPESGPEGLWVLGGGWVARIDPTSGEEDLRIPMGGGFALADGAAWLVNDAGLHRIDPMTGTVEKPVPLDSAFECANPKELAIAFESAWLSCKEGHVVRIDIATGMTTSIATGLGAHSFAVTEDGVWVTNYQANTVSRIDSATNAVTTIKDVGHGVGITTGAGWVWASTRTGIARIDPATASIVEEIHLGPGEYYELVWDEGIIWVSTRGPQVLKVDPSKAE